MKMYFICILMSFFLEGTLESFIRAKYVIIFPLVKCINLELLVSGRYRFLITCSRLFLLLNVLIA